MSKDLKRIQQRARELARSGRFVGSKGGAFELQFEPGYSHAFVPVAITQKITKHIMNVPIEKASAQAAAL